MSEQLTARAAIFEPGANVAVFEDVHVGPLRDDEVLVKLVATGICHTDLSYRGRLQIPVVLGHEGAGHVVKVGSAVTKVKPGDPVVLSFLSCGRCPSCEAYKPAYCATFRVLNQSGGRADGSSALSRDGSPVGAHFFGQSSFATYSVANERNVVKAPKDAPLELLGPLGCGVQTGAGAVMNVLRPNAGDSLLVIGAGGVGMSALMAAVAEGCFPVVVVEPNAARRELALDLGAAAAIDPINEDVTARILEVVREGVRWVVDTSGRADVIAKVVEGMGSRGGVALVAASPSDAVLAVPILSILRRGLAIHGVIEGDSDPEVFIPRLIELVMQGRFPLEKLVKFYQLDELNQAIEDQHRGAVIKPIIRMA